MGIKNFFKSLRRKKIMEEENDMQNQICSSKTVVIQQYVSSCNSLEDILYLKAKETGQELEVSAYLAQKMIYAAKLYGLRDDSIVLLIEENDFNEIKNYLGNSAKDDIE